MAHLRNHGLIQRSIMHPSGWTYIFDDYASKAMGDKYYRILRYM